MPAAEVLEVLELLEEGAIIPLIVAPAVFPLVGVVGAVGLVGLVGEPCIDDEESFPPHADANTIAAASPNQVMLRMAILRRCRRLDPVLSRVALVPMDEMWSQNRATASPAALPRGAVEIE